MPSNWLTWVAPALLGSCTVVEIGYVVPVRLHADRPDAISQQRAVRVWVVQDGAIAWGGGQYFWCDSLLWPIDAGASLVHWLVDASDPQVRTRWPGPLGWVARTGAIALPFVSARWEKTDLEWSILGLGASPSTSLATEGLDIVDSGANLASVEAVLVERLMTNTDSLVCRTRGSDGLREQIIACIVGIEWVAP